MSQYGSISSKESAGSRGTLRAACGDVAMAGVRSFNGVSLLRVEAAEFVGPARGASAGVGVTARAGGGVASGSGVGAKSTRGCATGAGARGFSGASDTAVGSAVGGADLGVSTLAARGSCVTVTIVASATKTSPRAPANSRRGLGIARESRVDPLVGAGVGARDRVVGAGVLADGRSSDVKRCRV